MTTPWRVYADPAVSDPLMTDRERKAAGLDLRGERPFGDVVRLTGHVGGDDTLPSVSDLADVIAQAPKTGLVVTLVGDADLHAIGAVRADDVTLLDVLDVDDALPGPWEYDVIRLGLSLALTARKTSDRTALVAAMGDGYQRALSTMAKTPLHSARARAREMSQRWVRDEPLWSFDHAQHILTTRAHGQSYLHHDRVSAWWGAAVSQASGDMLREFAQYRETASESAGALLVNYRLTDAVVGADGRLLVLLSRSGADDLLVLQADPVGVSPLEDALGAWREGSDIQRVLHARDLLPLVPDHLSGWSTSADGAIARVWGRARSLPDKAKGKKGKGQKKKSNPHTPARARAMGGVLGLAHARTGDAGMLSAYLGASPRFGKALAKSISSYTR